MQLSRRDLLGSTDGGGPAGGDRSRKISGDSGYVADYTPPGALAMVDQSTIDFFNKTYNAAFPNPKAYYDWMFGGSGTLVPSTDPAQDSSFYYQPEHGNINSPVNQPLSYTPPDPASFQIIKAALIAASMYAGSLALSDAFSGASVVSGAGADPLSFTAFDAGATDAGAADLAAAAQQGANIIQASGVDPMSFTPFDAGATPEGAADLQAAMQEGAQKIASQVIQQGVSPDTSLPSAATPAETAAHAINTASSTDEIIATATKAMPLITGAASSALALYKKLNPLSPTGQTLTAEQRAQLARQLQLTQQRQQAQNKNILLIGAIAAGVFLLARPDKRTKGKPNATRSK